MTDKIILKRDKSQEDGNPVHLWFENRKNNIIVSLAGEKGNVATRITTPNGWKEYAHPFASTHWTKYKHDDFGDLRRYKESIARSIKRDFGYDVELR